MGLVLIMTTCFFFFHCLKLILNYKHMAVSEWTLFFFLLVAALRGQILGSG